MLLKYLYLLSLLLSAATATIYRNHLKSRLLTIFIPYLWLVTVQEFTLHVVLSVYPEIKTGMVYNLYRPIASAFFGLFFYRVPFNAPVRRLIVWMWVTNVVITTVTFLFIQPIDVYNSYLSLANGMIITCWGIFFLVNYFNLDNFAEEKKWGIVIWLIIGIMLYYPVVNIPFAFHEQLHAYNASLFNRKFYQAMPQLLSVIMYSCFTYTFYLCKKKN